MKSVIAAIFLIGLMAAPGHAQELVDVGDSAEVKTGILRLTEFQNDASAIRGGGNSGKKLGVYNMGKDLEFHSREYIELAPAVKARWAVTLYKLIEQEGGGWNAAHNWNLNWLRQHPDQAVNMLNASLSSLGSPSTEGLDATYVPYDFVSSCADTFFRKHASDKYSKLGSLYQDWFRNDAILDGINLFAAYETRHSQNPLISKVWAEKNIERYSRRLGEEGKFIGEKKPKQPGGLINL